MWILSALLIGVPLLLLLWFVGLPALIHATLKLDANDPVRAVTDAELPEVALRGFEAREAEAAEHGYLPVGRFEVQMAENVEMHASLLVKPDDPHALLLSFTRPTGLPEGTPEPDPKWITELAGETPDGLEFGTTDAFDGVAVDQPASKRVWPLPGLSLADLLDAHLTLTAAVSPPPRWEPLPLDLSFERWMHEKLSEELREKAGRGFWREADGVFRPTWKGAFLSTWSQMPPIRGWREARLLRRSRADLRRARAGERLTAGGR